MTCCQGDEQIGPWKENENPARDPGHMDTWNGQGLPCRSAGKGRSGRNSVGTGDYPYEKGIQSDP